MNRHANSLFRSPRRRAPIAVRMWCLIVPLLFLLVVPVSGNEFQLVRRSANTQRDAGAVVQMIRLGAINDQFIEQVNADRSIQRVPLGECVALINTAAVMKPRAAGLVSLADGQRIPGEPALGDPVTEHLAWNHPWLGRIEVPLKSLESVVFNTTAAAPPPGELDVVLLNNGDHREGLINAIHSTIELEIERSGTSQTVEIPLHLVASIAMLASRPAPSAAKRIWFDDGTVIDVQSLMVGDDGYLRLSGSSLVGGTQTTRMQLAQVAAILLDARGMHPLAGLSPTRVEGPPTRYSIPKPQVMDAAAPLGLSAIEYHGPLTVRYAAPADHMRFSAVAELPASARQWGDCIVVIRSNDKEVLRTRLSAANPTANINAMLEGRELTVEILEGENGPIQDRVLLHRPMLLMNSAR